MTVLLFLTGCAWIGGDSHDTDLGVWSLDFQQPSIPCGSDVLSLEATGAREDGEVLELQVEVAGTSRTVQATSASGGFVWTVSDLPLDPSVQTVEVHIEGVRTERDESLTLTWTDTDSFFADLDGDGFGAGESIEACEAPVEHVPNADDCDDADPNTRPDADEVCGGGDEDCSGLVDDDPVDIVDGYVDADGDGAAGTPAVACDAVLEATDCDDLDADVGPQAPEVCSGVDDDCDGLVDDADPSLTAAAGLVDLDGDGHAALLPVPTCNPVTGIPADDCDDTEPDAHPGEQEVCDQGIDNDCNGLADDDDPGRATGPDDAWYPDEDEDGLGLDDLQQRVLACVGPVGFVNNGDDCDDFEEAVGGPTAYYRDLDGDHAFAINEVYFCESPQGVGFQLVPGDDCDDLDAERYPGAPEICDGEDDDCDGVVDSPPAPIAVDADHDGYGGEVEPFTSCPPDLDGYSQVLGDCDDQVHTINPGADELCDGVDNNCDLLTDVGAPAGFLAQGAVLPVSTWTDVLADSDSAYTVCGDPEWSGVLDRPIELTLVEDAVITGRLEVSGVHLMVSGGRLTPGATGSQGGALLVREAGELTLTDVTIACASEGTVGAGGAIAGVDSTVTVSSTTIDGCHADAGGAVWGDETVVTLIDTELTGNTADQGGAVFVTGDQGLTLGGTTTLMQNQATAAGGALHLAGFNTSLTIQGGADVRFSGNMAQQGGAIYTQNRVALGAAIFDQNTAAQGGALYLSQGAPLLQGVFTDNLALDAGGAVFVGNLSGSTTGVDGMFADNRVGAACDATSVSNCAGPGGAIHALAPLQVDEGASFADNLALQGGAIAMDQALLTVTGGLHPIGFDGNSAQNGNAISTTGGGVELTSVWFSGTGSAPAYVLLEAGTLTCVDCDTGVLDAVEFAPPITSDPFSPGESYHCDALTEACVIP